MVHRLKHSFSSGEISPLMDARVDFSRYKNGCSRLRNMQCLTQGPATRRSGFRFIHDLTDLGLDVADPRVREIPFIFNELQAYAMVFFMHTDGSPRLVFGDQQGLIVHPSPVDPLCPPISVDSIVYTGLGIYNLTIDIDADTDVEIRHVSATSVETVLTLTTDYTIAIGADPTPDVVTVTSGPTSSDGTLEVYTKTLASPGDIVTLVFPPTWDIVGFTYAQSGDEMYFAQSGLQPHILKRYSNSCWHLVSKTFTDQPTIWSDVNGWPEVVTFHQQRLLFAANLISRQTVWMTKAGDFDSFGVSAPLADDDAVTFTLDSGTQNKIVWMISGKALNIGTIGNEWTVVGATRTALTPTNTLAQRQTNHGSEAITPLKVGITTLFVEKYGRSVNEFVYDLNVDSYTTSDMAILSSHITEEFSIVDWTYQQTPDSIIWGIREDGLLIGITYQRKHEVIGWHIHSTLNGEFKAITSIPGDVREDEVWAIVKRDIDSQEKYYLEKLDPQFMSDDSIDARFLDSFIVYNGIPTDTVSGADHLEGETVGVLADGASHPDVQVVSGVIELNNEYSVVVIGKNMISEVWPTITDVNTQDGTSEGRMQRIINVDINLYRTVGMTLGRYDPEEEKEHDEGIPFREPGHLTGQRVPLFTGIKHLAFPEGYSRDPQYFVRQTQPLPLTVRAVIDNFDYYD